MKRDEAVLRELNLYPQWKLREGGGKAAGLTERSVSLRTEAASVPLGQPAASPLRGKDAPVQAVEPPSAQPSPADAQASQALASKSREQLIGELAWPELKAMVRDCTACRLRAGCTQTVFGVGDEKAEWLFVGEGPGADEDLKGEPFVGQAGKLLDNMLLSIKLQRGKNAYIGNIVKCRPPNNRTPEADEIATCIPYLHRQIALIKPKLIVALGKTAATSLLERDATLGSLRGKVHDYRAPATGMDGMQGDESSLPPLAATPLIVTYHPAYLLRTPMDKAKAWEDLCLAVETMKGLHSS